MPAKASDADTSKKQSDDALNVDVAKGLSSDQVKERQMQYGRNEVAEKQANPAINFCKEVLGFNGLDA